MINSLRGPSELDVENCSYDQFNLNIIQKRGQSYTLELGNCDLTNGPTCQILGDWVERHRNVPHL